MSSVPTITDPELRRLARCIELLDALERELVVLEWDHAAGQRSAEFLRSKFRDLLDIIEDGD